MRTPISTFQYVDDDSGLDTLITRLRQAERVALDTEADSLHHYFEKVCLIQVSFHGNHYLIDPLASINLSRLLNVLSTKSLIIHGADYDLRMLRTAWGFQPHCDVFDTMLAAQILGYEQLGLAALIQRFLNRSLPKQGQKSDWSRRPLTATQLEYACNDTRFLESIADSMSAALKTHGRCEWHRELCRAMVLSTRQDLLRNVQDAWRIKHHGTFTRQQLAYLRELWQWRDREAQQADCPPFKIMNNTQLSAFTLWAASHANQHPAKHTALPRHITGHRMERLQQAIQRASMRPEHEWPELKARVPSKHTFPNNTRSVDALRTECSRIATKLGIASSVLAPRAALQSIIRTHATTIDEIMMHGPLLRWQAVLLEPAVQRILGVKKQHKQPNEHSEHTIENTPFPVAGKQ